MALRPKFHEIAVTNLDDTSRFDYGNQRAGLIARARQKRKEQDLKDSTKDREVGRLGHKLALPVARQESITEVSGSASAPVNAGRVCTDFGKKGLKTQRGERFMKISGFVRVLAVASCVTTAAFAADREIKVDDRLDAAADTLTDMMRANDRGIPQDLIDKAHCVVVVPGMKKAGFIFGGKYGRGFAVCRRQGGAGWSAPAAMRVEGGSVGFQIGASETDVVLLVMNDGGMKHLLSDKFTLGGEATVAAGPIGRDASAQTDAVMHAEMLSYSRSRGVFAGISLEGATLRPDEDTNRELYGSDTTNREILTGDSKAPAAAAKFERALNRDSTQRKR